MTPTDTTPSLAALRRPIRDYRPPTPAAEAFQRSMLSFADELEELWIDDDGHTLEAEVVWSALHAFPALVAPGPPPGDLVELLFGGFLVDAETLDTLDTLAGVRRTLEGFEPPGFAAALWRATLLAVYRLIEVFSMLADRRAVEQCFDLLATAEAISDRLSGRA